jgi:hypothetical protein
MRNVTMTRDGNKLIIAVDMSVSLGPSASGKTLLIASTEGNATVTGPEGAKIGLNVYRPRS